MINFIYLGTGYVGDSEGVLTFAFGAKRKHALKAPDVLKHIPIILEQTNYHYIKYWIFYP